MKKLLFTFLCTGCTEALIKDFAEMAKSKDVFWPLGRELRCRGRNHEDWIKIGDVKIWNTEHYSLYIEIEPFENFWIEEVHINITYNNTTDFLPIVNRDGQVLPEKFTYQYPFNPPHIEDYIFVSPVDPDLEICWGMPEKCPTVRYIIVHADMMRFDQITGRYKSIGEGAFAFGDGTFNHFTDGKNQNRGLDWGWYNSYHIAGHQQ